MNSKREILTIFVAITVWVSSYLSPYAHASAAPAAPSESSTPPTTDQMGGSPSGAATTTSGGEYSPESREYHLKAAFLRYVAKFVEWPSEALTPGVTNICILGLVPSLEALNSINGKMIDERSLVISRIRSVNEAKSNHCQILFVTKTEEERSKEIINVVQNEPILAFGDMEKFAEKGGDMNFYIANNRLAIMINPPAVEKSRLKISPRMLRLVTVVPPIDQSHTSN